MAAGTGQADITWRQAFKTLGIYFLLLVAVGIAMGLMSIHLVDTISRTSLNTPSLPPGATLDPMAVVFLSVVSAIQAVLVLLFQYFILHLIAAKALEGSGTYRGLIHRGTGPLIVGTEISSVVMVAIFYLLSSQMTINGQANYLIILYFVSSSLFPLVYLGGLIVSAGLMLWFAVRVGQNYQFGWRKGCVTMLAWVGSLVLIAGLIYVVTFLSLFQSLSTFGGRF
jgi:hypothetical protein